MTRLGAGATLIGLVLVATGVIATWPAFVALGAATVVVVILSLGYVWRRPRVSIDRQIEPARVEKGSAAIALIYATNESRRPLPGLIVEQRLGDTPIRLVLPRLRGGESGVRSYRLPTDRRGVFEVGPVEVIRADPFGLCRTVQRLGRSQEIAVHPRLLPLEQLSAGRSRNLEGPSSDTSPQGTVTFHRLREYVVGDDLRTVHWPSTARTGALVVRHNVDTAQPFSVAVLDLRPSVYSAETFELAVDVSASVLTSMSLGNAPVQLRTTIGTQMGGLSQRDPRPLVDHLTAVGPEPEGSLRAELLLLRRDRGGTALIVVTGRLEEETLPAVALLRRRFDRLFVVSVVPTPMPVAPYPGVTVLTARNGEEVIRGWNREARR